VKLKRHIRIFWLETFILLLLLFLPEALGAQGNCPDGIAAYWKLDENSGSVYENEIGTADGTCVGSCPYAIAGTIENGQFFDGVIDSIEVTPVDSFNWLSSQSFSIELWLQRNDTPIGGGLEVFVGRADPAGLDWYIGINSAGNAQAHFTASDGSGPAQPLSGTKDIRSNTSTWHHVVYVRNAQTNQNILYVDGQQEAAEIFSAYNADFGSAGAPLTISKLSSSNYFRGALDEVAIYHRALEPDEIKSHYFTARSYCGLYDAPIRIMAMGDSITRGNWDETRPPLSEMVSFRLDLWELLTNNLYWFDFIGSEQNGLGLPGIDPTFDQDHAGFPGIRDNELYELLQTGFNPRSGLTLTDGPYLDYFPSDIVLLHIGTNGLDPSSGDVQNILNQIDTFSKNVTVVLTRIIDQSPSQSDVYEFNENVQYMAEQRIEAGDKIVIIDMHYGAGIDYTIDNVAPFNSGDMFDVKHPNPSGYSKMASKWFATLESLLPQSEVPLFTSSPVLDVEPGVLYEYSSSASGLPSPEYALVTGPSGMGVDAQSGLVQWTPVSCGDFSVTLRAFNWAGEHLQHYVITVNALPVAVSDNYNGVQEGGNLSVSSVDGVLKNDSDENDPLEAILVDDVSHGSLNLNLDGSFEYNHDGSDTSTDQFTYKASDGKAESTPVSVTLAIAQAGGSGGSGGGGGCFISSLLSFQNTPWYFSR
jgi:lysophospholipase L1-like esterase